MKISPSARSYSQVFIQEMMQLRYFLLVVIVGFLYVALSVYLPNYRFILSSIFGNGNLQYKVAILFYSLDSLFTAFSTLDAILMIITGLLLGINLALIWQTKKQMHDSQLKLVTVGGGLVGLLSAGCSSCGYSLLSILGLGTSLSFLPFGGKFLYFISIGALLFSIIYMTRRLSISKNCKL